MHAGYAKHLRFKCKQDTWKDAKAYALNALLVSSHYDRNEICTDPSYYGYADRAYAFAEIVVNGFPHDLEHAIVVTREAVDVSLECKEEYNDFKMSPELFMIQSEITRMQGGFDKKALELAERAVNIFPSNGIVRGQYAYMLHNLSPDAETTHKVYIEALNLLYEDSQRRNTQDQWCAILDNLGVFYSTRLNLLEESMILHTLAGGYKFGVALSNECEDADTIVQISKNTTFDFDAKILAYLTKEFACRDACDKMELTNVRNFNLGIAAQRLNYTLSQRTCTRPY